VDPALAAGRGRRTDIRHTEIAAGHLIERFRLFFLIMLGEAVLTTGSAFTGEPFAAAVALWWCYFQRTEGVGAELAETQEGAGAVGWWGTLTLTLIALALIAIAVGDELAVAHPGDDATLGFTLLTLGGPVLFLSAEVLFLRAALGQVPRSRPPALAALALLALATAPLPLVAGISASTAVLVAAAIADTVRRSTRAWSRVSRGRDERPHARP
jgi:low temperature requirement protein LtrA